MRVGGFQKTSLLDYPDRISAIIWTIDCNFRCPFCYNKQLVTGKTELIPEEEIISFLKKRKSLLEGLSISGGEPLLQETLIEFIKKVKKLNYKIKIDTNGSVPSRLEELIENNLLDYISMDIKAPKDKYDKLSGIKVKIEDIEKSINLIRNKDIDYEFKTTIVPTLLDKKDIIKIAKWLKGSEQYYLQQFRNDSLLISPKLKEVKPYSKDKLYDILNDIRPYFKNCDIRGV
jgi:pyruvate formate lyase activating enzyme